LKARIYVRNPILIPCYLLYLPISPVITCIFPSVLIRPLRLERGESADIRVLKKGYTIVALFYRWF